ncbi:MAG: SAM-dependent chlorinase/fluorinase [Chloroflexota bacterium]|nr:SAM-dependent chlorinase/fluorinase [Chloroflexota bacterium]
MASSPIITLTSDFGLQDAYVGAMKGVILGINPAASIVDISHAVRPQAIEQGAFLLGTAWPYFPGQTIHVAVVDPGVGTQRRALALRTPVATFVGPDNGVLSAALPEEVREAVSGYGGPAPIELPEGYRAVSLANEAYFRQPVSTTFHGRDVFAPAAAHLSLGVPLEELGEPVEAVLVLPPFRARRQADGSLRGRVIHIDIFGNLVTDIRCEDLPERVEVEIGGRRIEGVSSAYTQGEGLLAVTGSSGYLEVAVRSSSAARALAGDIGMPVQVRPYKGSGSSRTGI